MTPPPLVDPVRRAVTNDRLRLLSLGYYISGGIGAIMATFFLLYAVMFLSLSFMPTEAFAPTSKSSPTHSPSHHSETEEATETTSATGKNEAQTVQLMFRIFGGGAFVMVLIGWILSALTIYAGYCIRRRKSKMLVYIMGGYNCIYIPYGTLLGIATFLTLGDADAKDEYPRR